MVILSRVRIRQRRKSVLHARLILRMAKRALMLIRRPPMNTLNFHLTSLPFMVPSLSVRSLRRQVSLLTGTIVTIVSLLNYRRQVIIQRVLVILTSLYLSILRLPIRPSYLLKFTFNAITFNVPGNGKGVALTTRAHHHSISNGAPRSESATVFCNLILNMRRGSGNAPRGSVVFIAGLLFVRLFWTVGGGTGG